MLRLDLINDSLRCQKRHRLATFAIHLTQKASSRRQPDGIDYAKYHFWLGTSAEHARRMERRATPVVIEHLPSGAERCDGRLGCGLQGWLVNKPNTLGASFGQFFYAEQQSREAQKCPNGQRNAQALTAYRKVDSKCTKANDNKKQQPNRRPFTHSQDAISSSNPAAGRDALRRGSEYRPDFA
jgi:hypothetical protein